jgi:hypothetical protein
MGAAWFSPLSLRDQSLYYASTEIVLGIPGHLTREKTSHLTRSKTPQMADASREFLLYIEGSDH